MKDKHSLSPADNCISAGLFTLQRDKKMTVQGDCVRSKEGASNDRGKYG